MRCEDAQTRILASTEAPRDELATHLTQCAECRGFAQVYREVLEAPATDEPSRALDLAVLSSATRRLRGSRALAVDPPSRAPWPIRRAVSGFI